MIISKKKYEESIKEAVNKAMCEQDRDRWVSERFKDMQREFDRRCDHYEHRLHELEKKAFPERFEAARCPMAERTLQSC